MSWMTKALYTPKALLAGFYSRLEPSLNGRFQDHFLRSAEIA